MKFNKFSKSLAVVLLFAVCAGAQTVDEIIAKHVAARGGMDKLKAVQTAKMRGKLTVGPGMEAPVILMFKRPMEIRMEFTLQGMTGINAYDGKTGWQIMPFQGKKDAEAMSADDLKEIEENADIDGPLVDYKAKGSTVALLGKSDLEGTSVYKVKVTRKNGDVTTLYLDADSYLEVKEEGTRNIRGSAVDTDTVVGDYKPEGGIMFPHSFDSGMKGHPERQKITIETIELNPPVEDAVFKMPMVKKDANPPAKSEDKKPAATIPPPSK